MENKLTLTEANGETVTADILTFFSITETGNKYAIYTFNEVDSNGLIKLHVSKVVAENGQNVLKKIEDDNEWSKVKEIMKDMIVGGER